MQHTVRGRQCFLIRIACAGAVLHALVAVAVARQVPVAFVSNAVSGSVSVLNTADNTVLGSVAVGAPPGGIAFTSDRRFAYVTTVFPDQVVVIDTATLGVVAMISGVGSLPQAIAISPDNRFAYVVNWGDNALSVIDTATNAVVSSGISVGMGPQAIALTPDGQRACVVNSVSNDVTVINVGAPNAPGFGKATATIPVGASPVAVAITPAGNFAYVANLASNTVSVINTSPAVPKSNRVVGTIPVGSSPAGVAIANVPRRGALLYVTNFGDNSVSVINADPNSPAFNTVIDTIEGVGAAPAAIAITPKGDLAYITNSVTNPDGTVAAGFVSIIDTATDAVLPLRIPVGELPAHIAIAPINSLRLPTPVDTPTATPTDTATATETPTDTPTATATDTATPEPTPTNREGGGCCTDADCGGGPPGSLFCLCVDAPPTPPVCDTTTCNAFPPPANCGICQCITICSGLPSNLNGAQVSLPPCVTPTFTPSASPSRTPTPTPSITPGTPFPPKPCPTWSTNTCAAGTFCKTITSCFPTAMCPPPGYYTLCCPTVGSCLSPSGSGAPLCPGDCDGSGNVSSSERTSVTQIFFKQAPVSKCYAADINHDGVVSCGELNLATSNFQTQRCQMTCVATAGCPC